jgi:DNA-binding MarR family transcriptional regulator
MADPYEGMDQTAEVHGAKLAPELSQYTVYMLRRVLSHISSDTMQRNAQAREFVVLAVLADHDVSSQQEIAERLDINRTIMVKLIDRLESAGYLTRTRNPENRRSYVLSLTEKGRDALDDMRRAVAEDDERLTAALSKSERGRLTELLRALGPTTGHSSSMYSTEYMISQVFYALRRTGDALLTEVGLRLRHFAPLSAINMLGPCQQQELARHLAITESAAAQVVDELVQADLVTRGQDAADRRRYALELTELGRERLIATRAVIDGLQADVVATLGTEGDEELRFLLSNLLPEEGALPSQIQPQVAVTD